MSSIVLMFIFKLKWQHNGSKKTKKIQHRANFGEMKKNWVWHTQKKKKKKTQERIALIQNKNVSPKKSMPL